MDYIIPGGFFVKGENGTLVKKEPVKNNITPFKSILPHVVSEVICVHCGWRWVAVRPEKTRLEYIECPDCHNQGYVIETGETIDNLEGEE